MRSMKIVVAAKMAMLCVPTLFTAELYLGIRVSAYFPSDAEDAVSRLQHDLDPEILVALLQKE